MRYRQHDQKVAIGFRFYFKRVYIYTIYRRGMSPKIFRYQRKTFEMDCDFNPDFVDCAKFTAHQQITLETVGKK